jgi:predicted GIY-YIG superfamily endonuclease
MTAVRPELHAFDPKLTARFWPAICNPRTWPEFPAAPVGAHRIENTRSAVYRFYDEDRRALYIGVTTAPAHRWVTHRRTEWWPLVRYLALEPVDPATRLMAEQAAIRADRPRFNMTNYSTTKTSVTFENGMADVVSQFRRRLSDDNFRALVAAFKAEPDGTA